jgi:YggT family protein
VRFIVTVTEPVLGWIRRFIPPVAGLDFAPLIAILVLEFLVRSFLVDTLRDLSLRLG